MEKLRLPTWALPEASFPFGERKLIMLKKKEGEVGQLDISHRGVFVIGRDAARLGRVCVCKRKGVRVGLLVCICTSVCLWVGACVCECVCVREDAFVCMCMCVNARVSIRVNVYVFVFVLAVVCCLLSALCTLLSTVCYLLFAVVCYIDCILLPRILAILARFLQS